MKKLLLIVCMTLGCAYTPHGIDRISWGSTTVKRGTVKQCQQYMESYQFVRAHCQGDEACMTYWNVGGSTLGDVEYLCGKLPIEADEVADHVDRLRLFESELNAALQEVFRAEDNIKKLD